MFTVQEKYNDNKKFSLILIFLLLSKLRFSAETTMPTTPAAETATIRTRILPEIHRAATEGTTRPDWDLPRCPSEADAVAEAAKVTSGAAEAVSTETDSRLEAGRPHSEATTVVLRPWTAILIATAGLVQETATAVRKTGR